MKAYYNFTQNAIRVVSTGEIINSIDFSKVFSADKNFYIAGGLHRRDTNITTIDYDDEIIEDLTLTSDSTLEEMVEKRVWGTNGKFGNEPLKWVLLKDCELEHLKNILKNCPNAHNDIKLVIKHLIKIKEVKI